MVSLPGHNNLFYFPILSVLSQNNADSGSSLRVVDYIKGPQEGLKISGKGKGITDFTSLSARVCWAIFPCLPVSDGSDIQSNFPIQLSIFMPALPFQSYQGLRQRQCYGCLATEYCFGTSSVTITYFAPLIDKFRDGGRYQNPGGPTSNLVGRIYPANCSFKQG